ncbi:MAG: hypothetical protein L3J61_05590, partial [Ghiorsea sp.]|nr:hypothetical protein [Ghiorsea sp.]
MRWIHKKGSDPFSPQPAKKVAKLGRSESDPAPTEHELLKMIAGIQKAKAMYEVGKASNLDVEFYGR